MPDPVHYRPEIDGLRGIAILAVVLNHIDRRLLPGGFVGVDVFFVISGYLITTILCRDAAEGKFSFQRFYARRARRLLPAATVMAAVVMIIGGASLLPRDFKDLGASLVAYSAMMSNVLFWRWDDYFAGQAKAWPLLHTWSLAVEEQFYLVFPLLIYVVARWQRSAQLLILVCLFFPSLFLSVWQSEHDPRAAYYLLPSRAWELLAGGLCGLAPTTARVPKPIITGLGWAGLGCVVGPMLVFSERTVFPGWAATVPVAGTAALVMATAQSASPVKTMLSARVLVGTGLISYSLYLWHWPLLTLARYPWSGMPDSCPGLVSYLVGFASIGVAWASYHFVETPGRTSQWAERRVLSAGVLTAVGVIACGLVIHRSRGLPQRLPEPVVRYAAGMNDVQTRRRETFVLPIATVQNGTMPRLGITATSHRPDFVLWGDSHADALVPAFDEAARLRGLSGIALTRGATPPLVGLMFDSPGIYRSSWRFRDAAVDRIQRERPRCAILAARWSMLFDWEFRTNDGGVTSPSQRAEVITAALEDTLALLSAAGVKHIWLVSEVPAQRFNVPRQLALHQLFGWLDIAPLSEAEIKMQTGCANNLLQQCAGHGVNFLDLAKLLQRVSTNPLLMNGRPMYTDDNHLSATVAYALAPELSLIFEHLESHVTQKRTVIDVSSKVGYALLNGGE